MRRSRQGRSGRAFLAAALCALPALVSCAAAPAGAPQSAAVVKTAGPARSAADPERNERDKRDEQPERTGRPEQPERPDRPERPAARVGDPVRLRIPAIGLSAPVVPLGLDAADRLIAPERFDLVGWNRAGPEPGERGTAVIAGHVDSRSGPAVFYRLRSLRPGDLVHVRDERGRDFTFAVRRLARYPKDEVPDEVYAPAGRPELRLITCGGEFDDGRGSYRDNVVVYAGPA
ncbi:class F sortase [Actinocorallia populi]|uniref:class F sortase n=1 Tax=Actinocorallia populi TaxID=2079200 RepID=UPI000D088813|nr:class F sortase [Actinocorallia populi]